MCSQDATLRSYPCQRREHTPSFSSLSRVDRLELENMIARE